MFIRYISLVSLVTRIDVLTVGTALCSGAANAINMGREPEFDKQMPRTVGRPVVRGLITPTSLSVCCCQWSYWLWDVVVWCEPNGVVVGIFQHSVVCMAIHIHEKKINH